MDTVEYVAVGGRALDEVKRATGKRSAKSAVRAALEFAARYYGRPAYALELDLDKPHPDTLKSIQDFKEGRYSTYATAEAWRSRPNAVRRRKAA